MTLGTLWKAYEALLEEEKLPPILKHLFGQGKATQHSEFTSKELSFVCLSHCAMVSRGDAGEVPVVFPLDPSQRLAMRRFLHLGNTGAIAVSGAPGTGKTDMLRAVISSVWTLAALKQQECPIVLICGATNQSVENVMLSFDGAANLSEEITLRSRWLEGISDYAVSSPATSKRETHQELYQIVSFSGRQGTEYGGKAASLIELSYSSLPELVHHFTECMQQALFSKHCADFPLLQLVMTNKDKKHCLSLHERSSAAYKSKKPGKSRGVIKECTSFLHDLLCRAHALQDEIRTELHKALFTNSFLNSPLIEGIRKLSDRVPHHTGIELALQKLEASLNRDTLTYKEAVEGLIDVLLRPVCFTLAARYWEARWIEGLDKPINLSFDEKRLHHLRRNAMLFPCLVSTLHIAPRLLRVWTPEKTVHLFDRLDMLVVDESGQAAPSIAIPILSMARKILVVGDLKQLAPVSTVSIEEDYKRVREFTGDPLLWEQRHVLETGGSVMGFVGSGASYSEPNRQGILLRNHYRCLKTIIGYCIELLYDDHDYDERGNLLQQELQPQVKDVLLVSWEDTTGKGFPLPPMNFVQCGSVNDEPMGGGKESWTNKGEALKIVQWLSVYGRLLILWYEKAQGKTVDLTDVVAILTPFTGQAKLLRGLIEEQLDAYFPLQNDQPLSKRLTIGTVHTMQGAERDVILFSGVSKECTAVSNADADRQKVFLDRDGGNLLNVAVSRAKKSFVLFGHADLFFSPQAMFPSNDLPTAVLGRYMVKHGVKVAPKALVIVESPLKAKAIQDFLPDEFEVYGTGGHIRDLATLNLTPANGFHPEWQLVSETTRQNLQRTMPRLLQTPYLILATDPDPQGEAIAWHVLQVLKQHPWFSHVRVISRVVFSSITEVEIRSAFRTPKSTIQLDNDIEPESALDLNLVNAALALRILDGAIGAYYQRHYQIGMGRVQSAVLHLLAGSQASSFVLDVVLTNPQGDFFLAKLIDLSKDGDGWEKQFPSRAAAEALAKKLTNRPLPNFTILDETIEIFYPPEPLGTADVLALAWERYEFPPHKTTALMQQLYTGGEEQENISSAKINKQQKPLVTLNYGVLTLTEAGWDLMQLLEEKEPLLSSIETSQELETDLEVLAQNDNTYDGVLSSWSQRIFSSPPQSIPEPDGTFNDPELWSIFPEQLPDAKYHGVGDESTFQEFLNSIEVSENIESRAEQEASMSGTLAHPPLMPLSLEENAEENLSGDALQLYQMIYQHTLATVGKEALVNFKNVLYTSTNGQMGLLVQVATDIAEEGYFHLYPEAKSDIYRRFAPADFLDNLDEYRIQIAGIRPSDYSTMTPANTLLLMQRMGLGRPSTYAEHFRKLTTVF
ncbi:MAG: DNA topoisomerase [Cyanobacteria bacterium J06621_8]